MSSVAVKGKTQHIRHGDTSCDTVMGKTQQCYQVLDNTSDMVTC